jgi:hypothetical protein
MFSCCQVSNGERNGSQDCICGGSLQRWSMWGSCDIAIESERYASYTYVQWGITLLAPAHCHDDFNKTGSILTWWWSENRHLIWLDVTPMAGKGTSIIEVLRCTTGQWEVDTCRRYRDDHSSACHTKQSSLISWSCISLFFGSYQSVQKGIFNIRGEFKDLCWSGIN